MKPLKSLILVVGLFLYVGNMQATVHVVTNTNDNGVGSLRAMIDSANALDTVRFDPALLSNGSDTVLLFNEINVSKAITIKGLYSTTDTIFISGDSSSRIFNISLANEAEKNVTLDSVCIIDGYISGFSQVNGVGAGVRFSDGDSLFLLNSLIRNCTTYYVFTRGGGVAFLDSRTLIIKHSVIERNDAHLEGGGVYMHHDGFGLQKMEAVVEDSRISGNKGSYGGGIHCYADTAIVTLENSIISNNQASDDGGGIFCSAENSTSSPYGFVALVSLTNSTVEGNRAHRGGGVYLEAYQDASLQISHSDVVRNKTNSSGAGAFLRSFQETALELDSCSISHNRSMSGTGGIYANQITSSSTWTDVTFESDTGDHGALALLVNDTIDLNFSHCQFIGNVADEDGGGLWLKNFSGLVSVQFSHSTLMNNMAGDAGGGIFIDGSVYYPFILTITDSTSIRGNVANTNAGSSGGGGLVFTSGVSQIDGGEFYFNGGSELVGNGSYGSLGGGGIVGYKSYVKDVTIDSNWALGANAGVSISGRYSEWTNVMASGNIGGGNGGVGKFNLHVLSMDSCAFEGDSAAIGGAISVVADSVFISNSSFSANHAGSNGGAGYFDIEVLHINNTVFSDQSAGNHGGAIHVFGDSVFVLNSSFVSNSAGNYGGGIYKNWGDRNVRYENVIIDNNQARCGGGIAHYKSSIIQSNYLDSVILTNNVASDSGGGLFFLSVHATPLIITKSVISNNQAGGHGGGCFQWTRHGLFSIEQSEVVNNQAGDDGGGVFIKPRNRVNPVLHARFDRTLVQGNSAGRNGGGLFKDDSNTGLFFGNIDLITVDSCEFRGNHAVEDGGGIYAELNCDSMKLISNFSRFHGNSSGRNGGAISAFAWGQDTLRVSFLSSLLDSNVAGNHGGVAMIDGFGARMRVNSEQSTFSGNQADSNGAVICSIVADGSRVRIRRSTLSGNRAVLGYGGGIYQHSKGAFPEFYPNITELMNTTMYGNAANLGGGAICNHYFPIGMPENQTVFASSSIIAGNGPNEILTGGIHSVLSGGNNIFGGHPVGSVSGSDQQGIDSVLLNLAPLQDNGGAAPTHLPNLGSVAINLGNPTDSSQAQNGSIFLRRDVGSAESALCGARFVDQIQACESYTWPVNGETYTADAFISDTVAIQPGCDSITELILSIGYHSSDTISDTACSIYQWSANGQSYQQSGVYHAMLVSADGCDSSVTLNLEVVQLELLVFINSDTLGTSNSFASHQWLDCSNQLQPIAGATGQSYVAPTNGFYAVALERFGCRDTTNCHQIAGVGWADIGERESFAAYPNPTAKDITLQSPGSLESLTVVVRNTLGQECSTHHFEAGNSFQISLPEARGVYHLYITSAGKRTILKVIRQ